MFEKTKYKRSVGKLLKRQKVDSQKHAEKIKAARKAGKKGHDIQYMEHCAWHDYTEYRDGIHELMTSYLRKAANRLLVPTPDYDDKKMWYQSQITGETLLTTEGYDALLSDIMRRKKDNRDLWLPWVVVLTGLIAAVTGFIAALK